MTEGTGNVDERLIVMLEARIADFEKRMAQAAKTGTKTYQSLNTGARSMAQAQKDAFAQVSSQVGAFGLNFVKGLAVGAIAEAFASIAMWARELIATIGDMNDAAGRIGINTDQLQGLQYGFKLQGVEVSDTTAALEKFVDGIGQAAQGTGTLKAAFDANGISLRNQNGDLKSTDELLRAYADVVNKAPDAAAKMALVTDAFGRGGKAMVGALDGGAAALDAMTAAAKEGGYVLDSALVAKGAALDDKFDMQAMRVKVLFKTAVVETVEFIDGATAHLIERTDIYYAHMRASAKETADFIHGLNMMGTNTLVDVTAPPALDEITAAAQRAKDAMAGVVSGLMENENTQAAGTYLSDLSDKIDQLTLDLQNGKIGQGEFQAGLVETTNKAAIFMAALEQIDHIKLDGAYEVISGLRDLMKSLAGQADIAAMAMNAVGNGPHAGGDHLTPPDPYDTGMDRGQDGTFQNITFGPGGGAIKPTPKASHAGGAGGGYSAAVYTLLKDLQTQREALQGWYTESQALLSTATDAQLAILGGRHTAIERLEQEHQQRMVGLGADSQSLAISNMGSFFDSLASVTGSGGAKANKAFKVFAAAEALINVFRAQAQVLADPKLGFWGKVAAYAAIGTAGLQVVGALKGGGGKASSVAIPSSSAEGSSTSGTSGGTSGTPAALIVNLAAIDPKKLYEGQGIIDLASALIKEAGTRGLQWGQAT